MRSTATGIQLALAESDESRQDICEAIVTSLEHSQSDAQIDNANPSRILVVPYIRAEIRPKALHIHLGIETCRTGPIGVRELAEDIDGRSGRRSQKAD